jgi:hypothetical protein
VQFAYHSVSRAEYALKFYTAARKDESSQYMSKDSPLLQFLQKMHALVDNSNGDFQDACGRSMPPCIVMERGEALDKWVLRNKRTKDMLTCLQVQLHPPCVWQFDKILCTGPPGARPPSAKYDVHSSCKASGSRQLKMQEPTCR